MGTDLLPRVLPEQVHLVEGRHLPGPTVVVGQGGNGDFLGLHVNPPHAQNADPLAADQQVADNKRLMTYSLTIRILVVNKNPKTTSNP